MSARQSTRALRAMRTCVAPRRGIPRLALALGLGARARRYHLRAEREREPEPDPRQAHELQQRPASPALPAPAPARLPHLADAAASARRPGGVLLLAGCSSWRGAHARRSDPPLPVRSLISLSGKGTFAFLQRLVSNDVRRLEAQWNASASSDAFHCAVLDEQGRVIAPVFVYPQPRPADKVKSKWPHVLLECDARSVESLAEHMAARLSTKKAKHDDVKIVVWGHQSPGADKDAVASAWSVWALWDDEGRELTLPSTDVDGGGLPRLWRDPRSPRMGYRFVTAPRGAREAHDVERAIRALRSALGLQKSTRLWEERVQEFQEYANHRVRQGVPEGLLELPERCYTPLEANLDLMRGVDLAKGEDFAGTRLSADVTTGDVLASRIFPVRIVPTDTNGEDEDDGSGSGCPAPPAGLDIRTYRSGADADADADAEGQMKISAGKLLASATAVEPREVAASEYAGLASLRLDLLLGATQAEAEGHPALTMWLPHIRADGKEALQSYRVEVIWAEWWSSEEAVPRGQQKLFRRVIKAGSAGSAGAQ